VRKTGFLPQADLNILRLKRVKARCWTGRERPAFAWEDAMRLLPAPVLALLMAAAPASAGTPVHPCAAQATEQALKLLKFHIGGDERAQVFWERTRFIGTVKALRGRGRFDVIEVPGSVYKADYRLRLIYARIGGQCVLMGQEVLEESDPY
jgi:hypothetical protein